MKLFLTVVRKIIRAAGGAVNWQPLVKAGISLTTVLRWLSAQSVGVSMAQAPTRGVSDQKLGVSVAPLISGSSTPAQQAGFALVTTADFGRYLQSMGARIEREIAILAGRYAATSAAVSHPSGSTDWATPANAVGNTNGTNATVAGQALSAVDAVLTLSYPTLPNKTALTIGQVQLKVYAGFTKSLLGTPSLVLRYSLNGGANYTVLQTITATNAGPFTFDLTSVIGGNWTNLQALKVQAEFITALADITSNATLDAAEFLVDASYIPPTNNLSIGNVSAQENAGTLTFTVNRSGPSGTTTVNFATSDRTTAVVGDTAIVGEDYTSTSGTLTFTGSEASKPISVPLLDNAYSELDRAFVVNLSGVANGTLTNSQAIGTIIDDEPAKTFLQDLSGNGRDLTAGSTATTSRACTAVKFGNGRKFAAQGDYLRRADTSLGIEGSRAFSAVFDVDAANTNGSTLATYNNPGSTYKTANKWGIGLTSSLQLEFSMPGCTPALITGAALATGHHAVTVRQDDVAKTVVVKVDGAAYLSQSYTGTPTSTEPSGGTFGIGSNNSVLPAFLNGAVYDLRIWNTAKSQAALDAIVASGGKCKPEGDEIAWYRLEDI